MYTIYIWLLCGIKRKDSRETGKHLLAAVASQLPPGALLAKPNIAAAGEGGHCLPAGFLEPVRKGQFAARTFR